MIIEICGPCGAGKTTTMRGLMSHYDMATTRDRRGNVVGYKGSLFNGQTFAVVGPYEAVCGGAELMSEVALRRRLVHLANRNDHVLFESIGAGTRFDAYVKWLRQRASGNHRFAFIQPPYEVCFQRIADRRVPASEALRLHTAGETDDCHWRYFWYCIQRAKKQGVPHIVLDWNQPLPGLLRLMTTSSKKSKADRPRRRGRYFCANPVRLF